MMKNFFSIAVVLLVVSCGIKNKEHELLGTWNYVAEEASYGYQTGKVIVYEVDSRIKITVEIQGENMEAENLKIEGDKLSFSVQTALENAFVKLERKGNKLIGEVHNSEGVIAISMLKEVSLIGTWNYKANDAPYGFQTGKVIFYKEQGVTKAKIKIYGFTIEARDLKIEGDKVSFTTEVEHEELAIKLEKKNNKLEGYTKFSDGGMAISMVKKGTRKKEADEDQEIELAKAEPRSSKGLGRSNLMEDAGENMEVDYQVHTFYYGWFGNPKYNGGYRAWNHQVIAHWIDSTWNNIPAHKGGDDIGANFYPELGCYSSIDPKVIDTHMQYIRNAGIGVLAISWWGKDHYTNQSVQLLLDTAHKYGLKLAFHLEPYYKTISKFKEELQYIADTYNQHPALYRVNGKPMYYLYNSFNLKHEEWLSMLNPASKSTIRNTSLDGIFIGLWTTAFDGEFIVKSGFDGFYTYFASDGFAYGSTTSNWTVMSAFAQNNNLIYIPSVGPGYIDTRIRPWNEKNTKDREGGKYYEKMYKNAVHTGPDFISITSFNEWHEGTQIEPSIPKKDGDYIYEDFGKDTDPLFYIQKTKELVEKYKTEF